MGRIHTDNPHNSQSWDQAYDMYKEKQTGHTTSGLGTLAINPIRRTELVQLAQECADLFDLAKVLPHEKCYVGRLCRVIIESDV